MALAFDKAVEQPHFDKPSFRINKRIFATLDQPSKRAHLKLTAVEQSVFCAYDPLIFYPAAGAWGRQGWTIVELGKAPKAVLLDALTVAYHSVAAKK